MFKDKLRELREKTNLSQYELADKIFVSRSAIAKWENGNGIPSDVNLEALCKFFNVEEEWLLDRNDLKKAIKDNNSLTKKFIVSYIIIGLMMLMSLVLVILKVLNVIEGNYSALLIAVASILNMIVILKISKKNEK